MNLFMFKLFMPKGLLVVIVIASFLVAWKKGFFKILKNQALRSRFPLYFILGAAALFALLLPADQKILNAVQTANPKWALPLHHFGDVISHNTTFWTFLSVGFLILLVLKRLSGARVFFGMMLSAGLSSVLSQVFKFIICRARPYSEFGPHSFFNWHGIREHAFQSMPSGDVVIVAGAAGYLFFTVKNVFARAGILFLPFATAFYRISEDKHWPTDTLVSMAFGFLCAYWIRRKAAASAQG